MGGHSAPRYIYKGLSHFLFFLEIFWQILFTTRLFTPSLKDCCKVPMAQLYLVGFKEENYVREPEENYVLRELLNEHRSYCIPAGKTEVFAPYTPKYKLAEIFWLAQEIGDTSHDYWELIDALRAKYKKLKGHELPEWSKYFEDDQEECLARRRREKIWRREKGWLFQWMIERWTVKLRRTRPLPPEDGQ